MKDDQEKMDEGEIPMNPTMFKVILFVIAVVVVANIGQWWYSLPTH